MRTMKKHNGGGMEKIVKGGGGGGGMKKHNGGGGVEKGGEGGSDKTIRFERQVLVTFLGRVDDISTAELSTLQQTFASSYNALTASTSTFRIIETVTSLTNFTDALASRRLQSSIYPSALSGIRFQIIGHCQGCKNNLNLFTHDTSRRLQAVTDKEQSHHYRNLARGETSNNKKRILRMDMHAGLGEGGGTLCVQCSPPSNANFTHLYNTEVQRLRTSGVIQNVINIRHEHSSFHPVFRHTRCCIDIKRRT